MTLEEIRGLFLIQLKIEFFKRKMNHEKLDEKYIAFLMSLAQQRVLQELKPTKKFRDIVIAKNINTYSLPTDFGMDVMLEVGGVALNKISLTEIRSTTDASGGTVTAYAIYYDGDEGAFRLIVAPEPGENILARLWYWVDAGLYQPSLSKNQNWGIFDGSAYSGSLMIADKYVPLIIKIMLSQIFDELEINVQMNIGKIKELENAGVRRELKYKPLGGIN